MTKEKIELVANSKIVITADGAKTLARLYEGDKVIKRAEAKCAPEDTYDFRKGAELAYNRLAYGTDYHPSEVAFKPAYKPKFNIGDWVEIKHPAYLNGIGKIIEIHNNRDMLYNTLCNTLFMVEFSTGHCEMFSEDTLALTNPPKQDKPEPKPEPVKLYCTESYKPGEFLTKGKIYTIAYDGARFVFDDGWAGPLDLETGNFNGKNIVPSYLVPLVKRPAKVGEWVYLLQDDCMHINEKGSITKFLGNGFICDLTGRFAARGISAQPESEYFLVLDGYQPEPEYYSGKVIFTHANCPDNDDFFTVGKVYTVKDGFIKSNTGNVFNLHSPVKDIEELNRVCKIGSFIKYEGEA